MTDGQRPEKIFVTRAFLPPLVEYTHYLERIWQSNHLTNQGPLLKEFEDKTKSFLGVSNFQFVTNGTIALQLALRALDITGGEVITTPFSYVATTSSILWERCQPVFVDIDPDTFCIDAAKIEAAITEQTQAILAVHVYGNPCDVEVIEAIAKKHNLKVIYDAAHAFGVTYKGQSLLTWGDISTCSFHATKLFHTIEGGALVTNDEQLAENIDLLKRFGHNNDDHIQLGMNGKASEFQAAMGLCNLSHFDQIISERKRISEHYESLLADRFQRPLLRPGTGYNYAYCVITMPSPEELEAAVARLHAENIFPRRYFFPSLNKLPYLTKHQSMPISEDIAERVLCLPLYVGLDEATIERICQILMA